jgi:hypothetical protein
MEFSPSSEDASRSATKDFPNILWKQEVHYRLHKSHPIIPVLNLNNLGHTTLSYPSKIHEIHLLLFSHQHLGLPSGLFPLYLSIKIPYTVISSYELQILPILHLDNINDYYSYI